MIIDLSEIRKSFGQTFHFDFTEEIRTGAAEQNEIRWSAPLSVSLDVRNTGRTFIFSGKVKGELELICHRCLEWYPYHLSAGFEEEFCPASQVAHLQAEGQNTENIRVFEGNKVRLDDIILESILLGIPMKSVCRENCRGLCAVCGQNLNKSNCGCENKTPDRRWEGLQKYFEP